ncbi:MAG: DUF1566 domain-containing protein [Candidatus Thiodiazotropha sp. (ex Dulcina madagascariensis)]|nr:DUF1566 domain-containing protein [Candidatus Thiodiazotropha sp. (ex Dulcina madagascariensis)]MCU7928551.1 DUF1566 domain-containing protein [Candidatus Thiodiazotropha sp. (ex Dulcina madagascariensis)]
MKIENKRFSVAILFQCLTLAGCGGGSSGDDGNGETTGYTIGGTLSGLTGTALVLQNNGGDDLSVSTDGAFTFSTLASSGESYNITALTQPASPDGFCNVHRGSGTVSRSDITDVTVKCVTGLYNIVDTNQTACYNSSTGATTLCTGRGYDADYSGNPPDYTLSNDGTMITDNVTGLIWTQTPDTNQDNSVNVQDKLLLSEAQTYCSGLTHGGYTWRLPGIKELYSLILFSGGDPSGYSGTDASVLTPFIDDSIFEAGFGDTTAGERIIDGQYATATLYGSTTINGADTMFGVNFIDGRIKGYPYNHPPTDPKSFYVLCVTGNTSYGINDFADNSNGTVSDHATGLMWEQGDHPSTNFEDAISSCEAATSGGHSDWRLPNIKELQSIADYTRAPDITAGAAIDPIFTATSILNEGGATDWGYYWASTTHMNYLGIGANATYVAFGRALGYLDLALTDVHGAGAQRSNHKSDISSEGSAIDLGYGTFYYHGPQGDILRLDNRLRCVRNIGTP